MIVCYANNRFAIIINAFHNCSLLIIIACCFLSLNAHMDPLPLPRYAAESGASEQTEEKPAEEHKSPDPHDNYVNYDIAQVVLESRPKNTSPEGGCGQMGVAMNVCN